MEQLNAEVLVSGDFKKSKEILQSFVAKHANTFNFTPLYGQWTTIWNAIFRLIRMASENRKNALDIYPDCLASIRILSRDKTHLNQAITTDQFDMLLNIANIGNHNENISDPAIIVEALKCLCNLVYQSTNCQMMCLKNAAIDGIVRRLRTYKDANVPYDLQYFEMKLLFLITALTPDVRTKVRDDYHGLTYLVEFLDLIIKEQSNTTENKESNYLSDNQINLLNEIMRVLFNITVRNETSVATEEEEEIQFRRLAVVLHDLLLCCADAKDKQLELYSNTINLLTNVPTACYSELTTPIHVVGDPAGSSSTASINSAHIFEGHDVTTLNILLDYLQCRLENTQRSSVQQELLSPVLTVLVKCARCNSLQRRFLKQKVLPPTRDFKTRPEVGDHLQNRLIKLLTTPVTQVRDLVADFLFVLCKENVARMIKYTGYGNSAGLFANRGLLPTRQAASYSGDYSSNSDSDTEEYKQLEKNINPVTGCFEPNHPNPCEGMSEEQKEYEALKLVNLMDQLNRQGLVQPCKIGKDGRPEPVEHILELQDTLPQQD